MSSAPGVRRVDGGTAELDRRSGGRSQRLTSALTGDHTRGLRRVVVVPRLWVLLAISRRLHVVILMASATCGQVDLIAVEVGRCWDEVLAAPFFGADFSHDLGKRVGGRRRACSQVDGYLRSTCRGQAVIANARIVHRDDVSLGFVSAGQQYLNVGDAVVRALVCEIEVAGDKYL